MTRKIFLGSMYHEHKEKKTEELFSFPVLKKINLNTVNVYAQHLKILYCKQMVSDFMI